jgi:hypothetical protein
MCGTVTRRSLQSASPVSAVDKLRRFLRAVLDSIFRAAIIVLVAWPLLLIAVLAQERLDAAPPPELVMFFLTLLCAKGALLALLARRVS